MKVWQSLPWWIWLLLLFSISTSIPEQTDSPEMEEKKTETMIISGGLPVKG